MQKIPITQLYKKYHVPKNLELHMFWVSALGQKIIDHWVGPKLHQKHTVSALLLHDIGNLVKFELNSSWWLKNMQKIVLEETNSTNFLNNLKKAQTQMIKKYGKNSELANVAILKEIGVEKGIIELIEDHSWERLTVALNTENWEEKIVEYCDLRVIPNGLTTVENRMNDLRQRYQHRDSSWADQESFQSRLSLVKQLEDQLEERTNIQLKTITHKEIESLVLPLSNYEIEVEV